MKDSIRTHLQQLADEVDELPEDESQRLRETLARLERELGAELDTGESESPPGILDTVRQAIDEFEVEHPRATAILNDILIKLESMGI